MKIGGFVDVKLCKNYWSIETQRRWYANAVYRHIARHYWGDGHFKEAGLSNVIWKRKGMPKTLAQGFIDKLNQDEGKIKFFLTQEEAIKALDTIDRDDERMAGEQQSLFHTPEGMI